MQRVITTLMLAIGVTACAPIQQGFEQDLTRTGACADVLFFAANADGSVALRVATPPLIEAFLDSEEPEQVTAWSLPDPAVVVLVEVGSRVDDALCDDVVEDGGPQVSATYVPTRGALTVRLHPGTSAQETRADLILTDAVFVRDLTSAGEVTVERLEILDAAVGWFPG